MQTSGYGTVVLVHGILVPGDELRLLASRLRRCGFRTRIFRYPARGDLRRNAARLIRYVQTLPGPPVHCVGHSLGGLVILHALRLGGLPRGRVVLMGSPVQGSRVAQTLVHNRVGRWLLGASVPNGLLRPAPDWNYDREIGVIAGTRSLGVGQVITDLRGAHDGTVAVAETRLRGATDRIELPVTHAGLAISRRVARQICEFLHQGRFTPEPELPARL